MVVAVGDDWASQQEVADGPAVGWGQDSMASGNEQGRKGKGAFGLSSNERALGGERTIMNEGNDALVRVLLCHSLCVLYYTLLWLG